MIEHMLKLLVWRLRYEYWNLIAVLMQIPPFSLLLHKYRQPVHYFAFGANLDQDVLARRKIRVLDRTELLLRNHEMRFTQPGPYEGFGYASVQAKPGKLVYGHLLTLWKIDAIRMDYAEFVPTLHKHRRVWVTQQGRTFFFYQATQPQSGLIPTEEYRDKLLQVANKSTLIPKELLSELKQMPTLETVERAETNNLVSIDSKRWPLFLMPLLHKYNRVCHALVPVFVNHSLFARFIRAKR